MDTQKLEDSLKREGYAIKLDHAVELLITQSISTNYLITEVLRRLISVERQLDNKSLSDADIDKELRETADMISQAALSKKADLMAKLYIANKS